MEIIEVAAGVVRRADGRVLICRRTGRLEGLWEFPGGKLEPGETPAQCLERELMEELDLRVHAGETLGEVEREEDGRIIRLVFVSRAFRYGYAFSARARQGRMGPAFGNEPICLLPGGPGVPQPGAFVEAPGFCIDMAAVRCYNSIRCISRKTLYINHFKIYILL